MNEKYNVEILLYCKLCCTNFLRLLDVDPFRSMYHQVRVAYIQHAATDEHRRNVVKDRGLESVV